jgi:hypothetical protein
MGDGIGPDGCKPTNDSICLDEGFGNSCLNGGICQVHMGLLFAGFFAHKSLAEPLAKNQINYHSYCISSIISTIATNFRSPKITKIWGLVIFVDIFEQIIAFL